MNQIRIKHTDRLGNVAYIVRQTDGQISCVLANGTPVALSYAGVAGDQMFMRFMLQDARDGDDMVRLLELGQLGRARGSIYEWVNRPPAVSAQASYVRAELKALGGCEHHYLVQLQSDTGAKTKHMNLSPAKLARIAEILAEDEEEG